MAVPPPSCAHAAAKAALRRELRKRRADFVAALGAEREAAEARIAETLLRRMKGERSIAGYCAVGDEPSLAALVPRFTARDVETALPFLAAPDAPLRFVRWRSGDDLMTGPFGIRQPAADAPAAVPGAVLVPLLGFDDSGGRLGQGAGCYDRALAAMPGVRRIGVGWSVQHCAALPLEPWDMPLDAIVTEQGWTDCTPNAAATT